MAAGRTARERPVGDPSASDRVVSDRPAGGGRPGGAPMTAWWRRHGVRGPLLALTAMLLLSLLAPLLAPHPPATQLDIVGLAARPPSLAHPFGTDQYSRDVLSRVLHGGRVSLLVGALATLLSVCVGTAVGAVAGYVGGRVDALLMRGVDVLLSVPRLLLLIAVLALWGQVSVLTLAVLLGGTGWLATSRIVRGEVRALRDREFVLAARALGTGGARTVARHLLPNVLSPVMVAAALGIGHVIVLEAGLSFLGLGVQPPTASWGNIVRDGAEQLTALWWVALFPGLAIAATVMAANALADALRDTLDPRQLPHR